MQTGGQAARYNPRFQVKGGIAKPAGKTFPKPAIGISDKRDEDWPDEAENKQSDP